MSKKVDKKLKNFNYENFWVIRKISKNIHTGMYYEEYVIVDLPKKKTSLFFKVMSFFKKLFNINGSRY